MTLPKVRNFFLIIVLSSVIFFGGYQLGVKGYKAEVDEAKNITISREIPPDKNVDFTLFWQIWDTLGAKYYDKGKLIPAQMVYGAIQGMVASIGDPYTMFLTPSQNKVIDEDLSGSLEGVGIEIGYRAARLAVISPLPGSPAEAAGVKPGDYIVHIKDEKKNIDIDTGGISIPEAVTAIRGSSGTKVTLTLVREGNVEPIVVEITRAKLDIPSVTTTWVGENSSIANIKVSKFSAETAKEWDKAVQEILSKKPEGIILDLRNDPGGYLQAAITLASDFVPIGTTVVIQENGDGSKEEFESEKTGRIQNYKVVVLINGGSASAAEILAGALRDKRGFKLIGETSFGKGTIQEPVEITGGSGLHVTTAKWLTPAGVWVHGEGLEPDISIADDESTEVDEQLESAIMQF